jgi:hypothetical protein
MTRRCSIAIAFLAMLAVARPAVAAEPRDRSPTLSGWLATSPAGAVARVARAEWRQPSIRCPSSGQPIDVFGAVLAVDPQTFVNVGVLGICNYPNRGEVSYYEGAFNADGTLAIGARVPAPGDRMRAVISRHRQRDPYHRVYFVIVVRDLTRGWKDRDNFNTGPNLLRPLLAGAAVSREVDARTQLPLALARFSRFTFRGVHIRVGATWGDYGAFRDVRVSMFDADGTLASSPGPLNQRMNGYRPRWANP